MKRVLFINGSASPLKCGVGYYGEIIAKELAKTCEVHLLTSSGLGSADGIAGLHHIKNWKVARLPKITSVIKAIKPDVVHIQYPANGYKRELGINLLTIWLRIFMPRTPVVVTLHEYYGSALLGRIRNIITVFAAKKIIVSNQYDLDKLPSFLKRKISIVPIGSNVPVAKPNRELFESFMGRANLKLDRPVLAYFGFINESKGVDVLVGAAKDIKAHVLILSQLNKDNEYHNQIADAITVANNQGASVYLAGFLENTQLSQILQQCDLFTLPQPLPLTAKSGTAIAAAEHGLVIVSTAAEQSKYNLPYINDKNAVLLGNVNEQTFAETCNKLLNNPSKMKQLKNNTAELADYFAWPAIAKKHSELYDSIS